MENKQNGEDTLSSALADVYRNRGLAKTTTDKYIIIQMCFDVHELFNIATEDMTEAFDGLANVLEAPGYTKEALDAYCLGRMRGTLLSALQVLETRLRETHACRQAIARLHHVSGEVLASHIAGILHKMR